MEKPNKVVLSTTHTDSHGHQMTIEALQKFADVINGGSKLKYTIDHNRTFPPKGIVTNAKLVQKGEHHYLEGEMVYYEKGEEVPWNKNLVIEKFNHPIKFHDIERTEIESLIVSVDPTNFQSDEYYKKFLAELGKQKGIDFELHNHFRKSLIHDVELIFTVTLLPLIQPTLKKLGEKIADKLVDQIAGTAVKKSEKLLKFFKTTISTALNYTVPKNRPVFIVLTMPGTPHVELIAKTRNADFILSALKGKKLEKVKEEIDLFANKVDIDKIQFVLTEKGKWKFNFLITKSGESISRKITINKRDKRLLVIEEGSLLSKSGNPNSIGIATVKNKKKSGDKYN